jgi:hypothetical protein
MTLLRGKGQGLSMNVALNPSNDTILLELRLGESGGVSLIFFPEVIYIVAHLL